MGDSCRTQAVEVASSERRVACRVCKHCPRAIERCVEHGVGATSPHFESSDGDLRTLSPMVESKNELAAEAQKRQGTLVARGALLPETQMARRLGMTPTALKDISGA